MTDQNAPREIPRFAHIKEGDAVVRMLAGLIPMKMKVTRVDTLIRCGPWSFSRINGAEIDDDLGWTETRTGSYLTEEQA
jgi:hypothetical protein